MELLILAAIITGAALMIVNIYRYCSFMRPSRDVLMTGKKRDIFVSIPKAEVDACIPERVVY